MRALHLAIGLSLAIGLASCGAKNATSDAKIIVMPNVTGRMLDVALSDIERAGIQDEVEILGGGAFGVVVKSNWKVCDQLPAAGDAVTVAPRLSVERSCGDPSEATNLPTETTNLPTETTNLPTETSTAGTTYDPLKASASERYNRFSDLIVKYGGQNTITEGEALSVAGNFCDNDIAAMGLYVVGLQGLYSLPYVLASAAALADTYCPEKRILIEGALSALGITDPLPG